MRTLLLIALVTCTTAVQAQLMVETGSVTWTRSPCAPSDPDRVTVTEMRASGGSGTYEWRVVAGQVPSGTRLKVGGHWDGTVDMSWFEDNPNATIDVEVLDLETTLTAQRTISLHLRIGALDGYCGDPWDCSATPARGLPWAILFAAFAAAASRRLGHA